ncbi:MAG: hypothetical protein MHM6MM_007707 [Cercozoa sp. M6MM]
MLTRILRARGARWHATAAELQSLLQQEFGDGSVVQVEDRSGGCGSFFHIVVVSDSFSKQPRVRRQMRVNKALGEHLASVHGVTMQTLTKPEFERLSPE